MTDPANSLSAFFELWEFFGNATLAGVVAGATLGALGVWVVSRRMVFFAATLAQTSGLGIVVALIAWHAWFAVDAAHLHELHEAPGPEKTVFTAAAAFLVALATSLVLVGRADAARRDAWLGWGWITATAGTLGLGGLVSQEDIPNITTWMFSGRGDGGILSGEDLKHVIQTCVPIGILHLWWFRGFAATTMDAESARVRGVPVGVLNAGLVVSLAAAVSLCTWELGVLPVFAYSTLPAIAALRVSNNLWRAFILAMGIGAASGFLGFYLAFRWNLSVGATQAMTAAAFVLVAEAIALPMDLWRARRRAERATGRG